MRKRPLALAAIVLAVLGGSRRSGATNHEVQLDEVMADCGHDQRIQFVELLFPRGQNRWGGCAELAFFDGNGMQTAVFPFPHDVPDDRLSEGNSALIATQAFADLPGAPRPDFIIPPAIAAPGGKVCFRGTHCFPIDICLSYGDFHGDTDGAGSPAPALSIVGATSLQRFQRFEDPGLGDQNQFNSDFRLAAPAPRNDAGTAGLVVVRDGACHAEPFAPPCPDPGGLPGGGVAGDCSDPSCGNGVIDAGEECDDGNTASGDCCSASCRFERGGTPCTEDRDPCTIDRCNGAGTCEHTPCDGCLTCDPLGGCVAKPAGGCRAAMPGGASLMLINARADRKDRLFWRWTASAPTPKADFGDPLHGTDYQLCLYETGEQPAARLRATAPAGGLCAGAPCWNATRAGFDYADQALTPDGLLSVRLKGTAAAPKSTIVVAGNGPRLRMPPFPVRTPLRVQLRKSDGNACWEASYSEIHLSRSGARLTAKAD